MRSPKAPPTFSVVEPGSQLPETAFASLAVLLLNLAEKKAPIRSIHCGSAAFGTSRDNFSSAPRNNDSKGDF